MYGFRRRGGASYILIVKRAVKHKARFVTWLEFCGNLLATFGTWTLPGPKTHLPVSEPIFLASINVSPQTLVEHGWQWFWLRMDEMILREERFSATLALVPVGWMALLYLNEGHAVSSDSYPRKLTKPFLLKFKPKTAKNTFVRFYLFKSDRLHCVAWDSYVTIRFELHK